MFSVVFDFTHPRLCEELPKEKHKFFDIGETYAEAIILKNLMEELLNYNNHPSLGIVFEDFCKDRAISNKDNKHFLQILDILNEFKKWYTGSKTSVTKMYLVEREGNKVTNIYNCWKTYREKPEVYIKSKGKNKAIYV